MSVYSELNIYIDECDVVNTTIANCAITTSSIDMNNEPIVNVGDPSAPQDVVTLNYLDTLIGTYTFSATNNQSTPANVTGLLFSNLISGFETQLSLSILTTGNIDNLYAFYTIRGVRLYSGWTINTSYVGDISGIIFSIGSSGQLLYTSTDISNFISNTMIFKSSFLKP